MEQVNEHFFVEWKKDPQIVIYNVSSMDDAVINDWGTRTTEIINQWQDGLTLLSVHDFTATDSYTTTPTLRKHSKIASTARPELIARTAVVIPENFMSHIIKIFISTLPKSRKGDRDRKIFFNREDALEWLRDEYKKINDKS